MGIRPFVARSSSAAAPVGICKAPASSIPHPPTIPDASEQIMAEARTLLPGGVNSPVRAFKSVGGNPIVFDRVKGPYCWDVDGNKYVDYIGSWGPAIVGAANDEVNAVLREQIEKGTSFGAPGPLEVRRGRTGVVYRTF